MVELESAEARIPILLHGNFNLKYSTKVLFYHGGKVNQKAVTELDADTFGYATGKKLPSGLPIFDEDWELQGIHHTSAREFREQAATRVDSIWHFLKDI